MALAFLSPIGNGVQFFTSQGVILSGGLLYTYLAGTTTPQATYTDSTAVTPLANPIVLGSDGRSANEIWLSQGIAYKIVLKDSNNVTLATYDNISAINDVSAIFYLTSVAGTNSITATYASTLNAYAAGQVFSFIASATNTGAATLNINSLGVKNITKNGSVALAAGDIPINSICVISYDGTRFQLINVSTSAEIADLNGNALLTFVAATSSVNNLNVKNAATGSGPIISSVGTDSNVPVILTPKGTGKIQVTDGTDATKKLAIDAATVTTGTTRTLFAQDSDVYLKAQTSQVFTSSGTWTKPTGCRRIRMFVAGGGGGGGGAAASAAGNTAAGDGGAGGGMAIKDLDVSNIASSTITIGAAGIGGAAGNNVGTAGGTTTWSDGTNTITATGGNGGGGGGSGAGDGANAASATAGVGSGGDVNISGGLPSLCMRSASMDNSWGGNGGSSPLGGGGIGGNNGAGSAGGNYGGGGGGGSSKGSGSAAAGANGAKGIVMVYEFY